MSQSDKALLYASLKASGVKFDKHYREYTTEELERMFAEVPVEQRKYAPPVTDDPEPDPDPALPSFELPEEPKASQPAPPVAPKKADVLPGEVLSIAQGEPIRTDEHGRIWYQEEVRKPSFPKPRGRRILKYLNPGVERKEVVNGEYLESFEVSGSRQTAGEIKITLPSYQVGIYKDPAFPFKIHIYNEQRGFDLFEVQDFYGGPDLVPLEIKRIYVENVLCYDIRSTVRAIQNEYRQQQLAGRIKQ